MTYKKSIKPSKESVRRARLSAAFARLTEDEEYFRIDVLRRKYISFFYGGYYICFEPLYDTVVRCGGDHRYLGTDDYTIMFKLAKMLFKARERGDKEARQEKAAEGKSPKPKTPQGPLLFNPSELPTQRKPTK